jgi:energy-coupling factor transport system ATP-binding protein
LIPTVTDGHLSGKLSINGKDYSTLKMNELNSHIGSSVFQNPCSQFFTDDTISELVFPKENYGWSKDIREKKLTHLTEEFSLENLLDKNISFFRTGSR